LLFEVFDIVNWLCRLCS